MNWLAFILITILTINCDFQKKPGIQLLIPLATSQGTTATTVSLTNITPSSGTLSPSFSSSIKSYTLDVSNTVSSITITPTASITDYPITVQGSTVLSGNPSSAISLQVGSNSIAISLDPGTGILDSYSIQVTRAALLSTDSSLSGLTLSLGSLNPTFQASTTTYTTTLANAVGSITVTPTSSASTSQITVNGVSVTSGSASAAITMNTGANNISVVVTAENGTSTTYTLNIIKLASGVYRAFVTDSFYKGNLGGVSGADTKCNSDTAKPNDGSTYKALIVDDGTNRSASPAVNWVLKPSTTYLRATDGVSVFTTNASSIFTFGTLSNSFSSGTAKVYRTGLRAAWDSSSRNCLNWTNQTGAQDGRVGSSDQVDSKSIRDDSKDVKCNTDYYLLCVEQ